MKNKDHCPCGSKRDYSACCGRFIEGDLYPQTAEELMRSRYTSFVRGNNSYLKETWTSENLPKEGKLIDPEAIWIGLTVHDRADLSEHEGSVTFTALCIKGCTLCTLHETSLFKKRQGRWYYHTGDAEFDSREITRNGKCPCGSGKKFKRCCFEK